MIAPADRQTVRATSLGPWRTPAPPHPGRRSDASNPARRWAPIGCILAELAPTAGQTPRLATLHVSIGLLPHLPSPWAARFWEPDAPPGARRVEWLLTSRRCLTCLEDALELLDHTPELVIQYAVI